jgi:hypothetical protein
MKEISLGRPDEYGAVPAPAPSPETSKTVRYPSAYIDEYDGPEIADEGTITFRYRLREKTERNTADGKENCTLVLDLVAITDVDLEDESDEVNETAAEAMDRRLKPKKSR